MPDITQHDIARARTLVEGGLAALSTHENSMQATGRELPDRVRQARFAFENAGAALGSNHAQVSASHALLRQYLHDLIPLVDELLDAFTQGTRISELRLQDLRFQLEKARRALDQSPPRPSPESESEQRRRIPENAYGNAARVS